MLTIFRPKAKTILGIDIGSSSVKVLEINRVGDHFKVEGYGCETLPDKAVEGNVIKDIDTVASAIKRIMTRSRFQCKQAAIAVPDSSVISKVVQINEGLNEQEMEELVIVEADKYIPYPIDEINIDFEVIGPSPKNTTMLDVLIVASRAENVSTRVEAIARAGLEVKIVDVESYAVERALLNLSTELPAEGVEKIIAVLDIGSLFTHLYVMDSMKIIFSREEEFGSHLLIENTAQQYEMTYEQALQAHEQNQLPADYQTSVLKPFQEMMLLQIKRTLQFFYSTSHHGFVDYILLAGRVARMPGFLEMIQEQLGIPAAIADPFSHMEFGAMANQEQIHQDAPALLISCGLALRQAE